MVFLSFSLFPKDHLPTCLSSHFYKIFTPMNFKYIDLSVQQKREEKKKNEHNSAKRDRVVCKLVSFD